MRIHVDGYELRKATSWAARFCDPKVSNLAGIVLTAQSDVTLRTTDHETYTTVVVPAEIEQPGKAIVSGRGLAALVAHVRKGDDVCLTADKGTVTVKWGRTYATLPCIAADLEPLFPVEGDKFGEIDAAVLRAGLKAVLPAMGSEAGSEGAGITRTSGVEFTCGPTLTLASSDRARLSVVELDWIPLGEATLFVPGKSLTAVTELDGTITLLGDENTITLATDAHRITSSLIAMAFFSWRRIIPTEHQTVVRCDTAELLAAVRTTAALGTSSSARGKFAEGYLTMDLQSNSVRLSSRGDSEGSVTRALDPLSFEGDPDAVSCKPCYLVDALACTECEQVTLALPPGPRSPIVVSDGRSQHVIARINRS